MNLGRPKNKNSEQAAQEFYRELAADYDDMTNVAARYDSEKKVLQNLINRFAFKTVLDAACGSGVHAILLAELGTQVTGTDISAEMLEKARENSRRKKVEIEWIQAPMQSLTKKINKRYEAVICLGNSIPHLLSTTRLEAALQNFSDLLNPGGILILQLLNYQKILQERERIIGIRRSGNTTYIRFYDFMEELLRFNILTIRWEENRPRHQLAGTLLHPWQKDTLDKSLQKAGFNEMQFWGNLKLDKFDPQHSPNLVISARRKDFT
ncbi:MAG: methyltransferase domain-containing protein [Calditrichia bacterium]